MKSRRPTSSKVGQRYLIAIGSPSCPGLGLDDLHHLARDVQIVVKLFTDSTQSYERVLSELIPLGAKARQIRDALEEWFSSPDRRATDCVLVYVAAHADVMGHLNRHYILTSDTEERRLGTTAIRTRDLTEIFFGGTGARPQSVLLILDLCYAGAGAAEAAAALSEAKAGALSSGGSGLWIISSAGPRSEAGDGDFVRALAAVLRDDEWMPPNGMPFLNPIDLKDAINAWFISHGLAQRAEADLVGSRAPHAFVRNPRQAIAAGDGPNIEPRVNRKPTRRPAPASSRWRSTVLWCARGTAAALIFLFTAKSIIDSGSVETIGTVAGRTRSAPAPVAYLAQRGERPRNDKLPDGTHIVLAPDSRLRYAVDSAGNHVVTLVGEAAFKVQHGDRVFVVRANGIETRDLGTEFDVRAYPGSAPKVSVRTGRVLLRTPDGQLKTIDGGSVGSVDSSGVATVSQLGLFDWTLVRQFFVDAPLREIASAIGRIYDVDIEISGPELANDHITMSFTAASPEGTLNVLGEIVAGLQYEQDGRAVRLFRQ